MERTQGIILFSEKIGETDQLLSIFSKDFGKIKVIAQGIWKSDSKMRSLVQVGHMIDCVILPLRSGRHRLMSPSILETYPNIRQSREKLPVWLFSMGVFDRIVEEKERDLVLWKFLLQWFAELESVIFQRQEDGERTAQWFLVKLLEHLGGLDKAAVGHIPGISEGAIGTEAHMLRWPYLERAYQVSLGFSLQRYFLLE